MDLKSGQIYPVLFEKGLIQLLGEGMKSHWENWDDEHSNI